MSPFRKAVLAILLVCGLAQAQIRIPEQHRVRNRPPGYCGWCCIETLGRFTGVSKLRDLARNRDQDPPFIVWQTPALGVHEPKHAASAGSVRQKLDALGVSYKVSDGKADVAFLIAAVKKSGCVVFMEPGAFVSPDGTTGAHAVILTDYTDKTVEFIDPNTASYWHAGRDWFDRYWCGYALTIEP